MYNFASSTLVISKFLLKIFLSKITRNHIENECEIIREKWLGCIKKTKNVLLFRKKHK